LQATLRKDCALRPTLAYRRSSRSARPFALALVCVLLRSGCASMSNKWVALRSTPRNPLTESLGLWTKQGAAPTDRTIQLLRCYILESDLKGDRKELLAKLGEVDAKNANRVHAYAQAELAY